MTWGLALSWRRIGPFVLTSASSRHCSFWCISLIFAEHASQMWWFCWDSESCNVSNGQQTTKQCLWPFGASLALGSALELLSPTTELIIAACCIKYTLYCLSQSNREMVHCCIEKEKRTLQNDNYFDFQSAHEVPTYQAFPPLRFTSNAKWLQNGARWVLQQLLVQL